MASHLKIKDNEARWYCSVHQGADIARGTLERVVHPYPLRHAHTWSRVPSHCVWLLCRVFVWVQSQPTNVHTFLKTRERRGPHPVLDHAECYHHSGWVCDCHYYGVGRTATPDSDLMLCLLFTDGVRIESESQEQCKWMYGMFSHHCLPNPSWHSTLMEKGTPGAPLISHDGQFGQDQQAVVGDFYLLDQMGSQDQDPAAPGTHRVTGHDLLQVDQGDATVTDRDQNPTRLQFFENLTRGSGHCP